MSMGTIAAAAELRKILGECFSLVGLDFFDMEISMLPGHEPALRVHLTKEFTAPRGIDMLTLAGIYKALPAIMMPLRDAVFASTEVQTLIRESKERAERAEAEAQLNRDYRTHFELEMSLRHGKQP